MNIPVKPEINGITELFALRKAVYIDSDKFSDSNELPKYKFRDLVVIATNSKGTKAWHDFGAICYKKKTKADKVTHTSRVVHSTLDKTLEAVFDIFIRNKLSTCAPITARSYQWRLKDFSNYYFENLEGFDFNSYAECRKAYEQYTKLLLIEKARIMSSESQKGFSSLAKKQVLFAELICLYHNKDLTTFRDSYLIVKGSHVKSSVKPVSINELSIFYEINKRIFISLKKFLMENRKFPFIFSEDILEEEIIHYPTDGFLRTFRKIYFYQNGFIVNKKELEKRIDQIENSKIEKMSLNGYKSFIRKYYENNLQEVIDISNKNKSQERARLINYAIAAFSMCFHCESSINPAQIYKVKQSDLSNYSESIKGFKLFLVKPRANYKSTELLISAKMLPLLKEYKDFREWCLSLISNDQIDDMFFSLDTKTSTKNSFDTIEKFSGKNTLNYRRWVSLYMLKFMWINPNIIRKTVSNFILSLTGSKIVTSKKLGNTPNVVSYHYSEATELEHSEQLTKYFNHIYNNIANKYRKSDKIIGVNVNLESKKTAIGACKIAIPQRNSAFSNELETPNCSNPSSCLFCENYVVHSDQEDIRKLMSLKKILNISGNTNETLVIIKRINEILKILLDKYPDKRDDFINIANSVELGEFDEYWEDHLNLLLELGGNFHA